MGSGSAMLSTTWLITSAFVALAPSATTTKAGTMVTSRRTQIGMRKPTKPCMIIWPAMVPTVELDTPDAISETQEYARRSDAEQRRQGVIGGFDLGNVADGRHGRRPTPSSPWPC